MKQSITVHVKQEDIDRGTRWSMSRCPIANAMVREHDDGKAPIVGGYLIYGAGYGATWVPSRTARKFIKDFDSGREVQPATFRFKRTGRF